MMYETFEETINPAHSALLVTDVQNDFCKDAPRQAMIPQIARVIEAARRCGWSFISKIRCCRTTSVTLRQT